MKRKELLWVSLLLIAVPILFFHESLFTDKVLSQADVLFFLHPWDSLVEGLFIPTNLLLLDQTQQFFPWLSFARDEIRKGHIPFWNPYSYAGSPLLANGQSAVFSPFHLPFYFFPFLKMFSISACLRLFLAGFFMYLFLRSLGIGVWGATLSALGYQTCGFFIVLLNHPHSNPACLLPLIFWLTERLCQKPSSQRMALLSVALSLQLVSGHVMTAVIQMLVVFAYGLFRSKGSFTVFRGLLFANVLGIAAGSFVLLPTLEYATLSHARTYRLETEASFFPQGEDFKAMLTIFFPKLYGTPLHLDEVSSRNFNMLNQGFTGLVILAFALIPIFGRKREKHVRFFLALTFISFGAAYHLPILATLLDYTRLTGIFRSTSWLLFFAFSLSALAGIGIEHLLSFDQRNSPLFLRILLILILLVGLCGAGVALAHRQAFSEVSLAGLSLFLRLALGLLIALLMLYWAWSHGLLRSFFLKGGILLLVILEHFLFGYRYNPTIQPKDIFPETPGVQFLQSDPDSEPFRTLSLEQMLFPNLGMVYRLQDVRGYDAVEYEPYMHYLEKLGPPQFTLGQLSFLHFQLIFFPYYDSPLIDLLNVKYVLSPHILSHGSFRLVYDKEMKIYQNLKMFPRAYLFTDFKVIPDPEKQLDQLVRKDVDIRKTVLLKKSPSFSGKPATHWEVNWIWHEPNRFALDVTSNGSGILFLSEVDYPGWKATLDGEKAEILRANYLFRSVTIPSSGTHRVEMRYAPPSFKIGLFVSGITLLILLLLIFIP